MEGNLGAKLKDRRKKLIVRGRNISDRLAIKRHELQLRKNNLDRTEARENDMNVVKALQEIVSKNSISSDPISGNNLHNELQNHSRKKLECVVEGLLELVCKLTMDDMSLQSKAEKLARGISSLRNFNIFPNPRLKEFSTSRVRTYSHGSDLSAGKVKNSHEKKLELTPAETFAKYINFMLSEYFGEQNEDKVDMYKCLPDDVENLEPFATKLVEAGVGSIVETEIHINRKNNHQAFLRISEDRESNERDGIILLPVARRYAFEADIVRAFVMNPVTTNSCANKPDDDSKLKKMSNISEDNENLCSVEGEEHFDISENNITLPLVEDEELLEDTQNCAKAFVISILAEKDMREVVGSISFKNPVSLNSKSYFKLRPHDMKISMVYIPQELCVEEMKSISESDICGMLYVARILEVDANGHCIGELVETVGKVGNMEAEIKAILLQNGLKDVKPFEKKFNELFEGPTPALTEEDLKYREDMRKKCVFTIDPLTAKDLDDAVSVEKLNDSEYEIGVHISDVSFYLEENSELDNLVKLRATSIYLVTEVIHMLPTTLCLRCSLLPGEDKLAFSVFWKWHTEKKELSTARFTRSVINSCTQFAYEHAQKIIDNPMEDLNTDDLPDLLNGWTPNDIKWRVLFLHDVAQNLKSKRFENGALAINNPKLRFQLDPKTGEPLVYEVEGRQEANFLIEEFMLLANQSVAKFIHDCFPSTSILRNHAPPLTKSLKALKERLNKMGLEFDISSSKSIYKSMKNLIQQADKPKAVEACLSTLLTKPMARANYYCSEGKTSETDYRHYALSIPIYTHFTSPIRRYPDILVHRLLAAALNYRPPPQRTTDELHYLAKVCNDQKLNAKNAGDDSILLFFKRYIKAKQSITLKAVVIDIFKHSLNVVTIDTGHTIPINFKLQKVLVNVSSAPSSVSIVEKNSQLPPIELQLFSTVDINIVLRKEKIIGYFAAPDISQRRLNSKESSKKDKI